MYILEKNTKNLQIYENQRRGKKENSTKKFYEHDKHLRNYEIKYSK